MARRAALSGRSIATRLDSNDLIGKLLLEYPAKHFSVAILGQAAAV